jgi:hypothetical protein
VSLLLKFPKSPKVEKMLPPLHVTSKLTRSQQHRKELSASLKGSTRSDGKSSKGKNTFPAVHVSVS